MWKTGIYQKYRMSHFYDIFEYVKAYFQYYKLIFRLQNSIFIDCCGVDENNSKVVTTVPYTL